VSRQRLNTRQIAVAAQPEIHGTGALPAFAYRPHHQRLSTTHIPAAENSVDVGLVIFVVRSHSAVCIES